VRDCACECVGVCCLWVSMCLSACVSEGVCVCGFCVWSVSVCMLCVVGFVCVLCDCACLGVCVLNAG